MRFTRLRLTGFKSFVDPTDLVISEGLTGVVGPNGCGKSNLLEALRWVMGETRPSAMRGGGMEDVIFAGAASRPARNFAEVSLTIDNAARRAPQGFNDTDAIEVVRRITRDAGSAYKANGQDVRARDVQMLFADASTGAHSPALVRQGQIAELINAKPTARRRILEEAAGISGLYQRRHEAELKLRAAEGNLRRVDDVLEQLAAQLATLARQARAAARYREIAAALRREEGVLLWRRWRAAEDARTGAEAELAEAVRDAAAAERSARAAAAEAEDADEALPPLREEAAIAGAVFQRLLVERDSLDGRAEEARRAIATLEARLGQLDRDLNREAQLGADATATLERLAGEEAELREQGAGHAEALAAAEAAASEAAGELAARERVLAELTERMAVLVARHQSAERTAAEAGSAEARERAEARRAEAAREAATEALTRAEAACARAAEVRDTERARAEVEEAALAAAEADRAAAQEEDGRAAAGRAAARRELGAVRAEAEALRRLLDRGEKGEALLDKLSVAPGFEAALGAALGDDLGAPLAGDGPEGWADLTGADSEAKLPEGAEPLTARVTAPRLLARRLARIGVVSASDGPRLQPQLAPGIRLVSREGDLWRWDGLRLPAARAESEATLRLRQANRLAELEAAQSEAEAAERAASAAHEAAAARLAALAEAERRHRAGRRAAEEAATTADRALSRALSERDAARGRKEGAGAAAARHAREAERAAARAAEAQAALEALGDLGAARMERDEARRAVDLVRMTVMTRRSALDEVRRTGEVRERRRIAIGEEVARWSERGRTAELRLVDLRTRRDETEAALAKARGVPTGIAEARERLTSGLEAAKARRRAADDALAAAETASREATTAAREAERRAGAAREARAARTARAEAAAEAVALAAARIAEEAETDADGLAAQLRDAAHGARDVASVEAAIARLRQQRDAMGAVNLRAEEDAAGLRTEQDELAAEKADLEEAIRALRHGIAGLNREGRERLLVAFAQVDANFGTLFTHLFGGGEARLELVESDDPLEAGLEILCQPPGKKLSTLSLLSGGEQTLTALALIFAVFLANPAPICVLDEVDAPLDDANVTRFCDLLDEMTRRTDTRFLIITHHAVTMARMDRLYGVTMAEQGVSQLVSVDLSAAEVLAA